MSGDKGVHHVQPDSESRIMVQGLHTTTVPTKIDGDTNYIARDMSIEFLRPVFAGDKMRAETAIARADPDEGLLNVTAGTRCYNSKRRKCCEDKPTA